MGKKCESNKTNTCGYTNIQLPVLYTDVTNEIHPVWENPIHFMNSKRFWLNNSQIR